MLSNGKIVSSLATAALLSGFSISIARAEETAIPKQNAYPKLQEKPQKPAMTADEQEKLKKELINARDRQKKAKDNAAAKAKKP
jgi:hypothetical protein